MPVTIEKRIQRPKRGVTLAIAGGVLLVLLSLPLVLTLFPDGLHVGGHGIRARRNAVFGPPGFWSAVLFEPGTNGRGRMLVAGWDQHSYALSVW